MENEILKKSKIPWEHWLLIALATMIVISWTGYRFGWIDHSQYLLAPSRAVDQSFCEGDWFTDHNIDYHPVFTGLSMILIKAGVLEAGFFVLYCLMMFFLSFSLYYLCRTLFGGSLGARVFTMLTLLLVFVSHFGIAASRVYGNYLLPEDLAKPFVFMGIAFLFREKYYHAGFFTGVSGLFHAHVGVVVGLMLGLYCLLRIRAVGAGNAGRLLITHSVIAGPMVLYLMMGYPEVGAAAYDVLFRLFSLHYIPSVFDWQIPAVLLLFVAGGLLLYRRDKASDGALPVMLLALAIIFAVAVVFSGPVPVTFIRRLFLWRLYSIFMVLELALIAYIGVRAIGGDNWHLRIVGVFFFSVFAFRYSKVAAAASLFCLAAIVWYYWRDKRYTKDYERKIIPVLSVFVLPGMIIVGLLLRPSALLPVCGALGAGFMFLYIQNVFKRRHWHISVSLSVAMLFLPFALACGFGYWPSKPQIKFMDDTAMGRMAVWARNETPIGSQFLVPHDLWGFRLQGRRGVFVNAQHIIRTSEGIGEWKKRSLAAAGQSEFPEGVIGVDLVRWMTASYGRISPEQVAAICEKYGLRYIVAYVDQENFQDLADKFICVYNNEKFAVFQRDDKDL